MDERIRLALTASIQHWERLLNAKSVAEIVTEGFGAASCPLCIEINDIFHRPSKSIRGESKRCIGCPVYEDTQLTSCHRTPYYTARSELNAFVASEGHIPFPAAAIQEEIDYLRYLLPFDWEYLPEYWEEGDRVSINWPKNFADQGALLYLVQPRFLSYSDSFSKVYDLPSDMLTGMLFTYGEIDKVNAFVARYNLNFSYLENGEKHE